MKNHTAIERILHHIEARSLDLTRPYSNWLKLAFALSSLGESGRSYFHRLSRFHPDYDPAECDLQFSRCLESSGGGINLGSFFHMAKEAGIPLTDPVTANPATASAPHSSRPSEPDFDESEVEKEPQRLPTIPDALFTSLPELLQQVVEPAESREERDILLLGSLSVLSSCLPTVYGIYDGFEVYSNLYLYVTAAASSGKGKLNLCKRLVLPIHKKKRREAGEMQELYDSLSAEAEKGGEKPSKPKELMLLIPANSSATGVFQLLADNDGRGLIFETEGDTMSNILKADFGNYSDGYRKCFHHETISFYRRTDREYVDIQTPCLSTVLSGTPGQVHGLIPNAENGLFSRFLFYHLELDPAWKDTFRNKSKKELLDHYHQLGLRFLRFYELLCKQPPLQVVLTDSQQERFYHFFRRYHGRYHAMLDDNFLATVRRMGLNTYRFMMILSALRHLDSEALPQKLTCLEEDFETALDLASVLFHHSVFTFNRLPGYKETTERENTRLKLLKSLPPAFQGKEYLAKAAQHKISRASAYRILKLFIKEKMVTRKDKNQYELREDPDSWGKQF